MWFSFSQVSQRTRSFFHCFNNSHLLSLIRPWIFNSNNGPAESRDSRYIIKCCTWLRAERKRIFSVDRTKAPISSPFPFVMPLAPKTDQSSREGPDRMALRTVSIPGESLEDVKTSPRSDLWTNAKRSFNTLCTVVLSLWTSKNQYRLLCHLTIEIYINKILVSFVNYLEKCNAEKSLNSIFECLQVLLVTFACVFSPCSPVFVRFRGKNKTVGPNSMKLCKKLADILRMRNTGLLLPFRHRFCTILKKIQLCCFRVRR